jgi:hypothetical protein
MWRTRHVSARTFLIGEEIEDKLDTFVFCNCDEKGRIKRPRR